MCITIFWEVQIGFNELVAVRCGLRGGDVEESDRLWKWMSRLPRLQATRQSGKSEQLFLRAVECLIHSLSKRSIHERMTNPNSAKHTGYTWLPGDWTSPPDENATKSRNSNTVGRILCTSQRWWSYHISPRSDAEKKKHTQHAKSLQRSKWINFKRSFSCTDHIRDIP